MGYFTSLYWVLLVSHIIYVHPYLATWGNDPILAFIFLNVLKPPTSTNGQTVYFFSPNDPNVDPNFLPGTSWQYPPSALSQKKQKKTTMPGDPMTF